MTVSTSLATTSLVLLKKKYVMASKAYDAGKAIMSDPSFDALEAEIRKREPKWDGLKKTTHSKVLGKKTTIELAYPMASLNKLFAENPGSLAKWVDKTALLNPTANGTYMATPKLDGSAIQAVYYFGTLVEVATKGDGTNGESIMHLRDCLTRLPKSIKFKGGAKVPERVVVRMEAVVDNTVFAKKWSGEFETSRAMAAGLLNRTTAHPAMADINFVVLRVFELGDTDVDTRPAFGLAQAEALGFEVVPSLVLPSGKLHAGFLQKQMADWRQELKYDQDGIVVVACGVIEEAKAAKPKFAIAFKDNSQSESHATVIEEVLWQVSKGGKLVPKARIRPVKFNGTTVTFCALYNATMATEEGWGVGAKVIVRRSGDIIPEIIQTTKKAHFDLPAEEDFGHYEWDGVDLVLQDKMAHLDVRAKLMLQTVCVLGMEHLAIKNMRLIAETYPDRTPFQLMNAIYSGKFEALAVASGISPVIAKKALSTLSPNPSPLQAMVASGVLPPSVGKTQLSKVLESARVDWYDLLAARASVRTDEFKASCQKLLGPNIGLKVAAGIKAFYAACLQNGTAFMMTAPTKKVVKAKSAKFAGQRFSFTGYRDKNHESYIIENGGVLVPFGGKTTVLLYSAEGKPSGKVNNAMERGVRVTTFQDLE